MYFWKPLKFWRTGPCRVHFSIDVFLHACINFYFLQDVNEFIFQFVGGVSLNGSVSTGVI